MKIIANVVLISFLSLGALSCSNETPNEQTSSYSCPMKCEGEKTHSEPGQCSVCGMDLTLANP